MDENSQTLKAVVALFVLAVLSLTMFWERFELVQAKLGEEALVVIDALLSPKPSPELQDTLPGSSKSPVLDRIWDLKDKMTVLPIPDLGGVMMSWVKTGSKSCPVEGPLLSLTADAGVARYALEFAKDCKVDKWFYDYNADIQERTPVELTQVHEFADELGGLAGLTASSPLDYYRKATAKLASADITIPALGIAVPVQFGVILLILISDVLLIRLFEANLRDRASWLAAAAPLGRSLTMRLVRIARLYAEIMLRVVVTFLAPAIVCLAALTLSIRFGNFEWTEDFGKVMWWKAYEVLPTIISSTAFSIKSSLLGIDFDVWLLAGLSLCFQCLIIVANAAQMGVWLVSGVRAIPPFQTRRAVAGLDSVEGSSDGL